ncbi:LysR family transcriptional regulator substrate-binding protein, partial [Gammaproteobacteria bacterium]|nr:LysR family transcriptional regulator substrate-binding protein [Gammaproteobacteria bacterium]
LTTHGKDLYKEVAKIDYKISELKEKFIPNPELMGGKLVIYKQGEGGSNMTNLITKLRSHFPNLMIHVLNGSDDADISTEIYDLGFIGTTKPPEDSIATLLTNIDMCIYGTKDYFDKNKTPNDFEWVAYKRNDKFDTDYIIKSFFQNPNIIISSNSYQDAHSLVASGNGVTFLTDLDGESDERLICFNRDDYSFRIGFYLVQHELSRSNPIVAAVKKVILENTKDAIQDTSFVSLNSKDK